MTPILPPKQLEAYNLIHNAGEEGILIYELSYQLFGPRIGLQEGKIHNTRVTVCNMRKRLKAHGIAISFGKVSGRYRVEVAI